MLHTMGSVVYIWCGAKAYGVGHGVTSVPSVLIEGWTHETSSRVPFIYTLACARTFHDGAINSTLPHRIGYMEHLNVLLNAAAHPGGYLWTRS